MYKDLQRVEETQTSTRNNATQNITNNRVENTFADNRPKDYIQRAISDCSSNVADSPSQLTSASENPIKPLQESCLNHVPVVQKNTKPVIQRFKEEGEYHVSNDDTMAVNKKKNNHDLYATEARINAAETVLRHKSNAITLSAGAKDASVKNLNKVEVNLSFDDKLFSSHQHQAQQESDQEVELPSECGHGAQAVLGAAIKNERHVDNTFTVSDTDHKSDRIANLLARSSSLAPAKATWYATWTRLMGLVDDCIGADKLLKAKANVPRANILAAITEVDLVDRSAGSDNIALNFDLDVDTYKPKVSHVKGQLSIRVMMGHLDDKVNELEHEIMATVDAGGHGVTQAALLENIDIREKIIALYSKSKFPKATIDAALRLSAKTGSKNTYFADHSDDAAAYKNDLNIFANTRMKSFLQGVVADLERNIKTLTARRSEQFGTADGLNTSVDPEIGQAYGIIGGGFEVVEKGRWNWHWASVIMKSDTDNVTMEAHAMHRQGAETHNARWDFRMYGRPLETGENDGKTFHDIQRGDGFGGTPVTVLGLPHTTEIVVPNFAAYGIEGFSTAQINSALTAILGLGFNVGMYRDVLDTAKILEYYELDKDGFAQDYAKLPAKFRSDMADAHYNVFIQKLEQLKAGIDEPSVQTEVEASIRSKSVEVVNTLDRLDSQLKEKRRQHKIS